jgi:hypothetical protein
MSNTSQVKLRIRFHECGICLGNINKNKKYFLPCTHYYHAKCIKKHLEKNITCPLCKTPVFIQDYEQYVRYNKFLSSQGNTSIPDRDLALAFIKNFCNNSILEDGLNLEYINSDKVQNMLAESEDSIEWYSEIVDNSSDSEASIELSQNRRFDI